METTDQMDYTPDENEQEVLDVIRDERRVNPLRVREETGLRKQYVNDALSGLQKAGVVQKVNRGLYEHVPEEDDEYDDGDESLKQLRADRDGLQEQLEECIDEHDRLREAARVDVDAVKDAKVYIDRGLDTHEWSTVEDAKERLQEAINNA